MKNVAIVLAAGHGKRMHSDVQKQYLLIKEKPVLYYALHTFQETAFIHEVILVAGEEEITRCKKEIVDRYGFSKVTQIVAGGAERYDSVACGLRAIESCDYVYIHDGARPFVDVKTLERLQKAVEECGACVAGIPSKDTVKLADAEGYVKETPARSSVWIVQTPQVFSFSLIKSAYEKMLAQQVTATDDAMAVELMTGHKVRLVEADYRNIKITTPEDMEIARLFCEDF